MRKVRRTLFKDEKGLTLVEVLASIVILAIILTSVLLILVQTAKTNKTSEDIVDTTYVAQTEMENIYNEGRTWLDGNGYSSLNDEGGWEVFERNADDGYTIEVRIKRSEVNEQMTRVVIRVYDDLDQTNLKTQMENLFDWEDAEQ